MQFIFDALLQTRENFSKLLDGLSKEELLQVPEGFNNNILWNAGHVIVTQQLLSYGLAGKNIPSPPEFLDRYRKGSSPQDITDEDLVYIKNYMVSMMEFMIKDYESGMFSEFKTYETSYGTTLTSIDDAIQFLMIHEALHFGYAMAQRKTIKA